MINENVNIKDGSDDARLFSKMKIWDSERVGFHMPGHSGGRFFSEDDCMYLIQTDTTELSVTDDFLAPQHQIKEALAETAEIFGSAHSYFISSGSTTAIRVMLASVIDVNTHILISRQVHISILMAISLLGCEYSFIENSNASEMNARLWLQPSLESIKNALENNQSITDIIITSPNYYGDCAQINSISQIAHDYGCRLLVDEAHGAHIYFAGENNIFPQTALEAGADICVQSTHKTLPALTMASLLHISKNAVINKRVCSDRVKYMLRLLETSSPSFVIGASNFMAIKRTQNNGAIRYIQAAENVMCLARRLRQMECLDIFAADDCSSCDPMRIVVSFHKLNYSAKSVLSALEKEGVFAEYADLQSIVFIFSPYLYDSEYDLLYAKIKEIVACPEKYELAQINQLTERIELLRKVYQHIPERNIHVREAIWHGKPTEQYKINEACGCINSKVIMLCPPGIPILWPGEVIDKHIIEAIRIARIEGLDIIGLSDDKICVFKSE